MASKYLITKNVLNEYDNRLIDQKSMGIIEVQPLRERIASKVIAKKKDTTKTKPDKMKLLDFVYLTEQEYGNLITGYGIKQVKDIIQRLNDYIGSKGDKYKNHYYAINTRFNKAGVKRIDTQKELPPKPELKVDKPFVPLTEDQKIKAREMLLSFKTRLGK